MISPQLKDFLLLLLCLVYWPIRGEAKQAPTKIKRAVIFRSKPAIGDMVYVTPLFRAIKKTYPECQITMIGNKRIGEVIRYNPDIAEFLNYDQGFWPMLKMIRRQKPDFGCLANLGSIEGLALLYLSGTHVISVLAWNEAGVSWIYNILKKLVVTKPFARGIYVPPLYLSLLDPIRANTGDVHFRLHFSPEARVKAENLKDLVVGISAGGSTPDRWWPASRYAELANWLAKNYSAKIVLIGAGHDKEPIDKIIASLDPETKYLNFYNQSLDEFKATIARLKLIIGNDSGPMVTADAFDVPNIVLVGPTDEREYHRPSGLLNRVIVAKDRLITSISLETVKAEIESVLGKLEYL